MKLPENSIGISDLVQFLACPSRFEYGMKRHTGITPPESWSPANAFGSAVHHGIHVLDQTGDVDEAVTAAFREFKNWLEPDDLQLLRDDLETYLLREPIGYDMVMSETEVKVPLFQHPTEGWLYLRGRIDKLYVRQDEPTSFHQVDYKTSKWPKSDAEVQTDLQQWSYNFMLHESMPEIEHLSQAYDQLRYGIIYTQKNDEQRARMKAWLIEAVNAVIADDVMAPSWNQFCPWCPKLTDCSEIRSGLTDFALNRIAVLAPREPKLKADGTPGKRLEPPTLDPNRFEEYVEALPKVDKAKRALETYSEAVKAALKEMPSDSRESFGYRLREKSSKGLSASGLRSVYEELGDDFFQIADLSRAAAERYYGKGAEELSIIDKYLEARAPSIEIVAVT